MGRRGVSSFAVLLVVGGPLTAQAVDIGHQPVGCAVADTFPRIEAQLTPVESVATARVVFQPRDSRHWYSVAMKADGPSFSGVLPRPTKKLKAFQYYIEVRDLSLQTSRTPNYTTTVAVTPVACQDKVVAGSVASASVLLETPAGAPALPIGFASDGVVVTAPTAAAATAAAAGGAATVAGAAAASAGGGGLSTGAVVGIVAGGVGAVAAGVVVAGGVGGGEEVPTLTYRVTFDSNSNQTGIGLVECGGSPGLFYTWQFVEPDASGNFDALWGEGREMRAVGTAGATTFQATLTCTNGASRTGSISATGSPSGYNGTFVFGNSNGTVVVTREQP